MKRHCSILLLLFFIATQSLYSQFFTQSWVEYEGRINNNREKGERTRVNDREMSTHPVYSKRYEGQVNGLALISIKDTILQLERAELSCEMWGGHPRTANKRFQVNGGKVYSLPSEKTALGNCEYLFPVVPIDSKDLVTGTNALQFVCDRGDTFWGHFLLEEIAVNCYYKTDAPFLKRSGLDKFSAKPVISGGEKNDEIQISLGYEKSYSGQISEVCYFGYYKGYDWNGTGHSSQWHGYQFKRNWTGHIGTSSEPPYKVIWNTGLIPDQEEQMKIKALVIFKNGIQFWSEVVTGITFSPDRPPVKLLYCSEMPIPFWSRNKQLRTAVIDLDNDPDNIMEAYLLVRIWDGGEGTVKEPFKMNGIPYKITTGTAPHDLVSTINKVEPGGLRKGINKIELYSDTEHHGVEICMPGPALLVRFKKQSDAISPLSPL